MSSEEVVLNVKNLSKNYEIYDKPSDRLKQFIFPKISRLFGWTQKKYYQEFAALNDVSFCLKKGETVGIIGRNGSGKSTLLQIICGTLNPAHGEVRVNGKVAALLELGSGFNLEFTGRENIYLNATVLGLTEGQIESCFDAIRDFADIGQFIDQPAKIYSSGMLVRLAFAIIAHVEADILVIDEALAVGDVFFTQKCMRFLRKFMQTKTVIFVSHDTSAVLNLCNRAILLENGKLLKFDEPKAVIEDYLAMSYGLSSSSNIADTANPHENIEDINCGIDELDFRHELINNSTLRNDLKIFKFTPDAAAFGSGVAKISSVQFFDKYGAILRSTAGGEEVVLEIDCFANQDILEPIIGFQFKDRLGQVIFADNTYLTYQFSPKEFRKGHTLRTRFEFRMPVLPSGDYSISVAIAEGTQIAHVQHHWIHDALVIKAYASPVCMGLIGVPMKSINLLSFE